MANCELYVQLDGGWENIVQYMGHHGMFAAASFIAFALLHLLPRIRRDDVILKLSVPAEYLSFVFWLLVHLTRAGCAFGWLYYENVLVKG